MSKNALIVVDLQNGFINQNTQELPNKISKLIKESKFDYVLFSKFVNNTSSSFHRILEWYECYSSPEIDIHKSLIKYTNANNVFEKSTYSVFKSEMANFIKQNQIKKLFLCGIDISACVLASAYEAFDLGYEVEVLKNYSLSFYGEKLESAALELISKNFEKQD